jgi:hypothetical protein
MAMAAGTLAIESHVTPVTRAAGVPWTIWCLIAGSASGMIGGAWDISWHMSIGRDMFWTPPHILIQLNAVLSGTACAVLILTATLSPQSINGRSSVKIWGFRGPIGAFVVVRGCMVLNDVPARSTAGAVPVQRSGRLSTVVTGQILSKRLF